MKGLKGGRRKRGGAGKKVGRGMVKARTDGKRV